jgi:hypothetical protein
MRMSWEQKGVRIEGRKLTVFKTIKCEENNITDIRFFLNTRTGLEYQLCWRNIWRSSGFQTQPCWKQNAYFVVRFIYEMTQYDLVVYPTTSTGTNLGSSLEALEMVVKASMTLLIEVRVFMCVCVVVVMVVFSDEDVGERYPWWIGAFIRSLVV